MEVDNNQNEIKSTTPDQIPKKPIVSSVGFIATNKVEPHSAVVETLAGDMADVIGSGTGTSIKDIIHGAEEHDAEKRNLSPESKKNKVFMLVSFLLLAIALAALAFLFLRNDIISLHI